MICEKQNFKDGQVLCAENLNRIEDTMEEIVDTLNKMATDIFVITYSSCSFDRSGSEIIAAYQSSKQMVVISKTSSGNYIMPLTEVAVGSTYLFEFCCPINASERYVASILIESSGIVRNASCVKTPLVAKNPHALTINGQSYDGSEVVGISIKGGSDGVSPVVAVSAITGGHRITITDKNGTKTVNVMDGKDGQTPKKGTDYWDSEEKAEIVAEVIDSIKIEYPDTHVIYGDVDSNNTITIYGELADGNYVLKYEYADGSTTNVGTIKVGGVSYDNLADPTSADWAVNKRLNSSAELADATGCQTTNFFKCAKGDIIRVKGLDIRYTDSGHTQKARAWFFNAGGSSIVGAYPVEDSKFVFDGTDTFTITLDGLTNISGGKEEDIVRGRLSGMLFAGYTADDVVITVNQEITG